MGLLRLGAMPPMVPPSASVLEAVDLMTENKVGALAVTEDARLVGVFTERDLMKRVVARRKDPATTPVGEVMSARVLTVNDETSVQRAATIMRENHVRHLPIVDGDGRLEGMLAQRYLLYEMMDELAAKVGDLEGYYLMEDSHGG